ncbi:hypothetical protein N9544_04205 [Flavobacteriales bacterium]|nr:hypothetical protein [Flavobacteriales bacterium]
MDESKIIIGENKLTDEEVKQNEDFGQLMKKHQQFVKKKKWINGGLIAGGVFLIMALVLYFNSMSKTEIIINEPIENEEITPALGLELQYKEFLIIAENGAFIRYNNTNIEIPELAFVDSNGGVITGEVSILYKEFHKPVDFFLSGIPMTYDSAGTEFQFESAGMFVIRGEQNGEPVFLDKSIIVKLASEQKGDYFNKYYYDEETNKWDFISKDLALNDELIDSVSRNTKYLDNKIIDEVVTDLKSKISKLIKQKPREKSPESVCIKLEMDSNEFPDFSGFKDVLFEIDESDENFSEDLAEVEWDDIKLRKKDEIFELMFFKKFKKTTIKTKPVFEGESCKKAMKVYTSENGKKLDSLNRELNKHVSSISQFNNEVRTNSNIGAFVTRIFEINDFGIYNSDCPRRMPKGQLIATQYLRKSDKVKKDTIRLKKLYLVEENKNILYTLSPSSTLSYNPNNKYVIWGVTIEDKLVVYKSKEFAKIPLNYKGIYNIEFELIEKDLYAEEVIKKELDIEALF